MCTNMQSVVGLSVLLFSVACAENCSTWFHPSVDGHNCSCGPTLGTVVVCNNETREVGVLDSYCLTSSGEGNNTSVVVGRCLAAVYHGETLLSPVGIYAKVLPNISDQEKQTCGYLNRQGQLCGKCKYGHFVSAYSYDLKCHNVTSTLWIGIVKYLCIAYLPLTVFLCVVIVFRISVTSQNCHLCFVRYHPRQHVLRSIHSSVSYCFGHNPRFAAIQETICAIQQA